MKKIISALLCLAMLFSLTVPALAEGNPNLDGGGGGMGQGTSQNSWTPGRDGVRITIIRDSDNTPVANPIDFSNQGNGDIVMHFGTVSKISYRSAGLTPHNGNYHSIKPSNPMPRIIISGSGNANIEAIRNYFCRENHAGYCSCHGLNYDDLISGSYKILLEPIAYFKYSGVMFAMTATEAALYNKQVSGGLRSKMVSLTHKNLPLAMFLETPDLGFPLKVNAVKTAMRNAARGQISWRNPRKMTLNMTHGNGAAVVVRARESLVHGEGWQFTILIQNKERCVRH